MWVDPSVNDCDDVHRHKTPIRICRKIYPFPTDNLLKKYLERHTYANVLTIQSFIYDDALFIVILLW